MISKRGSKPAHELCTSIRITSRILELLLNIIISKKQESVCQIGVERIGCWRVRSSDDGCQRAARSRRSGASGGYRIAACHRRPFTGTTHTNHVHSSRWARHSVLSPLLHCSTSPLLHSTSPLLYFSIFTCVCVHLFGSWTCLLQLAARGKKLPVDY